MGGIGATIVIATVGTPPPSPGSSGAVSRSRSKTNNPTEFGANGSQFHVPPSAAAASDPVPASADPASIAASATGAAASGVPASVQLGAAGGAAGGVLATQRHQFLALTWRQMGTAGSHMPPVAAAAVPLRPPASPAPPSSVTGPVGQSVTLPGLLVTFWIPVYGFSTMSISVSTGAPGLTL